MLYYCLVQTLYFYNVSVFLLGNHSYKIEFPKLQSYLTKTWVHKSSLQRFLMTTALCAAKGGREWLADDRQGGADGDRCLLDPLTYWLWNQYCGLCFHMCMGRSGLEGGVDEQKEKAWRRQEAVAIKKESKEVQKPRGNVEMQTKRYKEQRDCKEWDSRLLWEAWRAKKREREKWGWLEGQQIRRTGYRGHSWTHWHPKKDCQCTRAQGGKGKWVKSTQREESSG